MAGKKKKKTQKKIPSTSTLKQEYYNIYGMLQLSLIHQNIVLF
jgi:hypothetical protein